MGRLTDDVVRALADSLEVRRHLSMPRTGVYIVRHDGHIVWASPSMLEVTGRAPGDLIGGNGWDVFVLPEELARVATFKAHLADADGVIWMRLRMPRGPPAWFRVDTWVRQEHILCAFRPEGDRGLHHVHWESRSRP